MKYANNIAAIDELSASEGVFTTAQAQRLGISRNALSHACKVGRLERVAHGAYRLSGAPNSETDEAGRDLEAHGIDNVLMGAAS